MHGQRYAKNAGAVFSLKYHIVWCPKYRRPVLTGDIEHRLRVLLAEKSDELGMTIHALEIMPDHVHLFVESDPTRCVAEIVNRLKGFTVAGPAAGVPLVAIQIADALEPELLRQQHRPRLGCDD